MNRLSKAHSGQVLTPPISPSMKLFSNASLRLLAQRLKDERRRRVRAETERDDYRARYLDAMKYALVTEHKPSYDRVMNPPQIQTESPGSAFPRLSDTDMKYQRKFAEEDEDMRRQTTQSSGGANDVDNLTH